MTDNASLGSWDRIAGLRFYLKQQVNTYLHHYRGRQWYVLHDRATSGYYRFNTRCQLFISQLDGVRTLQEIVDSGRESGQASIPSQDEIVQLLAQLYSADLLRGDFPGDLDELLARQRSQRKSPGLQRLIRPLSMRFPLADPDRFLEWLSPYISPLFSRSGLLLWSLVVSLALIASVGHWPALQAHWSSRALDPQNILLMILLYPLIKTLHELGHATATKAWGGEVHELGVMFLVFMPIPYMDATAAGAFANKWRRVVVGAAGIMVETFIAGLGMLVWLNAEPGVVRDIGFNVMLIGSVSTLLFNGNPLLRFDGYYVLADLIEIPNLGPRANRYLGYLVKRYVFGMQDQRSPVTAQGERSWFVVYGISAFFYRLFISFTIAFFVASQLFILGVLLAILFVSVQVVYPLIKSIGFLFSDQLPGGKRSRALSVSAALTVCILVTLFAVPMPSWTRAEGVLHLPEESMVRAEVDGFVVQAWGKEDEFLPAGSPLFKINEPTLKHRKTALEWKAEELKARQTAEMLVDRAEVGIIREEIAQVEREQADIQDRIDKQLIVSNMDGVFASVHGRDLLGRFVNKGDLLGYIADFSQVSTRVVVRQETLDLVRRNTESVEVRLASKPGTSLPGTVDSEVPLVATQLPSAVLGSQEGGAIAVDARDVQGLQAIGQVYQLDVRLPAHAVSGYIGSKVYLRFNHSPEPIGRQWMRSLRQLFLSRLAI